jgi:peptidyl-prolyl cis-trans isomerase D
MLQAIRRGSRSWFGIILAVILIPPFAVVGVDYVFRGGLFRSSGVITVGDADITGPEFRSEYFRRISAIQPRFKQSLDFQTATKLGIVDQMINAIAERLLYQQAAAAFGILVGDDVVRQEIYDDPAFHGVSGKFDAGVLAAKLRNAGLTEAGYAELRRRQIAAAFLIDAARTVGALPADYVNRIYRFRNEKRTASLAIVPTASIKDVPAPTDKQLAAYHKDHAKRYTAPEYRKLTAIVVTAADVASRIKIDDAMLKAAYASRKREFTTPEKRQLVQIVLPDEAAAKKAEAALLGGRSFETVAKEVAKRPIVSLGTVTKDRLPLPALRDAAFKAGEGEVTKPIKSPLGWHIVRVVKIIPAKIKPFDAIKDKLRADIVKKRAGPIINDLRNQVDDALGGGLKLAEIAKRLGLKLYQIAAIDRKGQDEAGKPVAALPDRAAVIAHAFKQKPGGYLEVIDLEKKQGFFVVAVDKIIPSALRPLAKIRARVVKDWIADQRDKRAMGEAELIAKKVRDGQKLAEAVSAEKLSVSETKPLARYGGTGDATVSKALRNALFRAPKVGAVVVARSGKGWAVARLTKIDIPKAKKNAGGRKKIADALKQAYGDELAREFDGYLRQRFPIKIDHKAIDKLFGRS